MEAFPATFLATNDAVLADAVPAQLQHALGVSCTVVDAWDAIHTHLQACPPCILIADLSLPHSNTGLIRDLRDKHPLLAILAIGSRAPDGELQNLFATLPLSTFLRRPLAIASLVRSFEHLSYERRMTAGNQQLPLGSGLSFNPAQKRVLADSGQHAGLTDKEVGLLLCLYHHRGAALPRNQLLEQVWGYGDGMDTHTLETHLYRLRQKLKELTGTDSLIETAQGSYRLKIR